MACWYVKDINMNTQSNWGGARQGAGRPRQAGRKKVMFYITDKEKQHLKAALEDYRTQIIAAKEKSLA